jgi:hypothetical protein
MLVAKTTIRTGKSTTGTVTFSRIDDAYKQVIAFRPAKAPAYMQGLTWTSAADSLALSFEDAYELPVRIWAICPGEDGDCTSLPASRVNYYKAFLTKSNGVLRRERVGITLIAASGMLISDETGKADNPTKFKDFRSADCEPFRDAVMGKRAGPDAINIYVVSMVHGEPGLAWNCDFATPKIAVAGAKADWTTLLHEVAHNFALDDVDPLASTWDSPPEENFMYSNTNQSTRRFFTEGQIFRAHFSARSVVNTILHKRIPDERDCRDANASPCPALQARVWADE